MRKFSVSCVFVMLAACGAVVERVEPVSRFDPAEVAWSQGAGNNTVTGQAFMRQSGGGVVTCAGEEVQLTPRSRYNVERAEATFGSADEPAFRSFASALGGRIAEKASAASKTYTRMTVCDAEGDFVFEDLPDGDYFLATQVRWSVGDSVIPEGGILFAPVSLSGGTAERVLMRP